MDLPDTLKVGRWYQIAWMYNGGTATENAKVKVYLGGKLFYDATIPTDKIPNAPDSVKNSNFPLVIGDGKGEPGNPLGVSNDPHKGLIDDVRIYQDELTSAQIQKLYAKRAIKRGLLVKE